MVSLFRNESCTQLTPLVLFCFFLVLLRFFVRGMLYFRVWILRHVAMGYSVHLQRFFINCSLGYVARTVPNYHDITEEGSDVRGFVFSMCECVYALHVKEKNGAIMGVLYYQSPLPPPSPLVHAPTPRGRVVKD